MKAIIFDLDGVLVDSEPCHAETLISLAGEVGIELSAEDTRRFIGIDDEQMWSILIHEKRPGKDLTAKDLAEIQLQRTLDRISSRPLPPREGVTELLKELASRRIMMGVASSSPRRYVDHVLQSAGLLHYFPVRVSGDEVKKCKPDPEAYRTVMEVMGIPPHSAAAVEDSLPGIRSARDAGLLCIGLGITSSEGNARNQSDLRIDGFLPQDRSKILHFLVQCLEPCG